MFRLGTGVPIGTRGTVVGIMLGRTNLDTYYEILFDNLPVNSLESILLGKNQQKCRIKVHSYHLINYTHALRLTSVNYHQQRSIPSAHTSEQPARSQQPNRPSKHESNDHSTSGKPKSAPPLPTRNQPFFPKNNAEQSIRNNPPPSENLASITSLPINPTRPTETIMSSAPANPESNDLFYRAIQDSGQIQYPSEQTWNAMPAQYYQHPCM